MQHIEHANASFPSTAKIVIIAPLDFGKKQQVILCHILIKPAIIGSVLACNCLCSCAFLSLAVPLTLYSQSTLLQFGFPKSEY